MENLEPKLQQALDELRKKSEPTPEFQQKLLTQLMRRSVMLSEMEVPEKRVGFFRRYAWTGVVSAFFVVTTGGLSTYAYGSDAVTRGSLLYPVKRAIERAEKSFASTPEKQVEYHLKMVRRRLAEVRNLNAVGVEDKDTIEEFSQEFNIGLERVSAVLETDRRQEYFDRFENLVDEERQSFAAILPALPVQVDAAATTSTSVPEIAPETPPVESQPAVSVPGPIEKTEPARRNESDRRVEPKVAEPRIVQPRVIDPRPERQSDFAQPAVRPVEPMIRHEESGKESKPEVEIHKTPVPQRVIEPVHESLQRLQEAEERISIQKKEDKKIKDEDRKSRASMSLDFFLKNEPPAEPAEPIEVRPSEPIEVQTDIREPVQHERESSASESHEKTEKSKRNTAR